MGHRILEAADGPGALAILAQNPDVDLVLLDLHMAPMDGLALLGRLREDPATRELPVICISALARDEDQKQARQAGANGYVVKPFRRRELIAAVDAVLRESGRLHPEQSDEPN